ncbi:histidine phosphatase family protein [Psychromonas sp.]|nr:histidine phosphatase family protein [Psychromonas sp.]
MLNHHIYLLRHGDVDLAPDVCYGQLDCNVADSFDDELLKVKRYLVDNVLPSGDCQIETMPEFITSPLKRCYQLADGLTSQLNGKSNLQTYDAFKEINFGSWEGINWVEIGKNKIDDWNENFIDFMFPEGESAGIFHERVMNGWHELLDDLAKQKQQQTFIIVTHAGVIRSILSDFLHIPLSHSLSLEINKLSISCLRINSHQNDLSRCVYINHTI